MPTQGSDSIPLGEYASLVELMRSTPAEKLQPLLAQMILKGETDLKKLIAAGALANAVTFGGCDYVGFHTAMAMLPALEMSRLLASGRQPLPVLKVLYRNAQQIQSVGGASKTTLAGTARAEHAAARSRRRPRRADPRRLPQGGRRTRARRCWPPSAIRRSTRSTPCSRRCRTISTSTASCSPIAPTGWWACSGKEYSYSLLRQCVRFCADHERMRIEHKQAESPIRALLPKLLDQYKLAGKTLGKRDPGDAAVDELSQTIYNGPRDQAAEAVAAALADGIDPEVVGEAISLASNLYVLRQGTDNWRTHGDSAGVHSSDATNAWRNMARVAEPRHAVSGLIVAAYHAGHPVGPVPDAAPTRPTSTAPWSRSRTRPACWRKPKTPSATTTRVAPRPPLRSTASTATPSSRCST